jgi:hypothetical protein
VTYIAADGDTDVLHWDKMLEFCRLSVSLTRENRLTASPSAQCPYSVIVARAAENSLRVRADAIDRRHLWMRRSQQL